MTTAPVAQTLSPPSCTVIIPAKDRLDLLKPCVESVLNSPYDGVLEVLIVDNGSTDAAALSFLEDIQNDERVAVIRWDKPFNFSEINNMAARKASGDVLCFLNNDTKVKTPFWLTTLATLAARDDVGTVGPLLLFGDDTVQHAGLALDRDLVAGHKALTAPLTELEQRYDLDRSYSVDAITAACMFTRKALFLDHGGFDEQYLALAFNDVDYCLRLREAGYTSLILPAAQLYHYAASTRSTDRQLERESVRRREQDVMLERWQHWIALCVFDREPGWAERSDDDTATPSTLPQREPLVPPSVVEALKQQRALNSETHPSNYDSLTLEYKALEAHALNLQEALDLTLNSTSWRVTGPLRRILSVLRGVKQRAGLALVSTEWGRKLYSLKDKTLKPASSQAIVDVERLKLLHSETAKKGLAEFLASNETIVLPDAEQPQVSIVLVLFNQAPLTLLCLRSLVEHTDVSAEIIVVDNNSTDDSAAMMAKVAGAKLITNTDNVGFVHAVNQGAEIAQGKYILLLNNDALLQPGSLRAALDVFATEDKVGAVGGRIRLLDDTLQEAGSIIWQDGTCLGYGRGADPQAPEFMFRRDVDYCSGAFLMIPRGLFNELNGFDTDYAPAYYEESDFCVRLMKAGYRIIYEPDADIVHYEFASSGGYAGASKLQQEHRQILCEKHHDFLSSQYAPQPENILKARSRPRGPRVLVLDDRVPHASLGAGYPRCREVLHDMSALGLQITLYPLSFPSDDWSETYRTLPPDIEVMLDWGLDRLADFLTQRRGFYDYIMISRNHNMERFNKVVQADRSLIDQAVVIYDSEALTAPREALALRLAGQPVSVEQEQKMIAAEVELARDANRIVTVSEAEADTYRQAGFNNVMVLGHKAAAAPTPRRFADRIDFLFVGALRDDNSPNVDSLIWFCDRIFPRIRQLLDDNVSLTVIGDSSAPSIRRLATPKVRFMGRQDSIEMFYDRARVFIAPTRFAAGIPHKIHEAAAHGIPVVATGLLTRQLGWTHGEELLSADAEHDFADQCVKLYSDPALWQSVRENALAALERDCSPQTFNDRLKEMFDLGEGLREGQREGQR